LPSGGNLCDSARFTGYQINGGYAEYTVADARYAFPDPAGADAEIAPWLCAGLIGYRSLRPAGDAERLGLYGFGAAAHIIARSRGTRAATSMRSRATVTSTRSNLRAT
jgi:propanol-preferring alcohol dehydrogenase